MAIPSYLFISGLLQFKRHSKDLPWLLMCSTDALKRFSSPESIHLAIQRSLCLALPTLRSLGASITNHVRAPSLAL